MRNSYGLNRTRYLTQNDNGIITLQKPGKLIAESGCKQVGKVVEEPKKKSQKRNNQKQKNQKQKNQKQIQQQKKRNPSVE